MASEHLTKAKAALADARALDDILDPQYTELLICARVQAEVAQAEALDRIATVLEQLVPSEVALHA